jgi:hypothetical protein
MNLPNPADYLRLNKQLVVGTDRIVEYGRSLKGAAAAGQRKEEEKIKQ